MEALIAASFECAVAGRNRSGEQVSGDRHLARSVPGGVLLAVVDGLGHGRAAGEPAARAVDVLDRHAGEPLADLLRRCHGELTTTRGVTIGLAAIRGADGRLAWLGVGNVSGVLARAGPERGRRCRPLPLVPGIVGSRLPKSLEEEVHLLKAGDAIVLATDGIGSEFIHELDSFASCRQLAESIVERHAREADDALVLVARYRGPEG